MKLLPYVVLNIATLAVALVVYESVRAPAEPPADSVEAVTIDAAALEGRLRLLETSRAPALRVEGTPPELLARLAALEEQVRALSARRSEEGAGLPEAPSDESSLAAPAAPEDEPTEEAIARFRKLQEAVRRQDRIRREEQRVGTLLGRHGIRLTAKQQREVAALYASFQARRNQVWTELKQEAATSGDEVDWKTVVRETNLKLQREFAESAARFLPASDADQVARALMPAGK